MKMWNHGARACVLAVAVLAAGTLAAAPGQGASRLIVPDSLRFLVAHNRERASWQVPAMTWDPALAAAADRYAGELARTGRWGHSDAATRPGQGENLWMGTRGAFSPEQMVGGWLSERRLYRAGVFPQSAATGGGRMLATIVRSSGDRPPGSVARCAPRGRMIISFAATRRKAM